MHGFLSKSGEVEKRLHEMLGDEFDAELQRVMQEYAEMISRSAAVYILGSEKGLVRKKKVELASFAQLPDDGASASFKAEVLRVFVPLESKMHRTLRTLVKDNEGREKVLVLWDAKVDEALRRQLRQGDRLEVDNAHFRNGEFHAGMYSSVLLDKGDKPVPLMELKDGRCIIAVRIVSGISARAYMKDGEERQMASCWVSDGTGRVRMLLWNDAVGRFDAANPGSAVKVAGAIFRNGELHVNEFSEVTLDPVDVHIFLSPEDILAGVPGAFEAKLISVYIEGGVLCAVARSESKDIKAVFSRDALARLFRGELSPDIDLNVASLLKLKSMLGAPVSLEGRMNENGVFECASVSPTAAAQKI